MPDSRQLQRSDSAESGRPAPVRVLIVDDHPLFRKAARTLLEMRGYAVVGEAEDATSAFDAVERLAPEGVLLDVRLGADDGFDVARALSQMLAAPVVVLISSDNRTDEQVHECGAPRLPTQGQTRPR
jgi:DNA-binding NarL/FixJ family response regulator